jgi:hypothetical protein
MSIKYLRNMDDEICAEVDNVNLLGEHISAVKKSIKALISG